MDAKELQARIAELIELVSGPSENEDLVREIIITEPPS